jgi:hypothetical protein
MHAVVVPGAEAALLGDALDVPASSVTPLSREPLGDGSVAGFQLDGGDVAYVDTSLLPVAEETGMVLEGVARVWLHPSDPHLPALAPAAFGEAIATLLARLGIDQAEMPELIGYRPGRRAVLRVPTVEGDMWVKVVRPRRIQRVVDAHTSLREAGLPVPVVRGWSTAGLLVLESAAGHPATDAVWEPEELLDAVVRLRGRLSGAPVNWPARTSFAERVPWYVASLRAEFPERAAQLQTIAEVVEGVPVAPTSVAIHGDLHIGQLFVEAGEVSGLIDVDTAGAGAAEEDSAAFIAHAVASALLTERQGGDAARVRALASAAHDRWGQDAQTRALTSVHLLGHALGTASGGDRRRAEVMLDTAERLVTAPKSPLIAPFEEP